MKELSASHFRAWLESRSPQGSVGEARRERSCPLARYLGPGWRVHRRFARYVEPGPYRDGRVPEIRRVPLPRWARRFVQAVDELPIALSDHRRVWPRTALQLLDECERPRRAGLGR